MILLLAVLAVIAGVWLLPLLSDVLALVKVLSGRGAVATDPPGEAQRLLFLVPAHNEEGMIGACVSSLVRMGQARSRYDLYVVADNCTDATARIAEESGATALERFDPEAPGKPPAIQWALDRLPVGDYDAVVIIDADTVVEPSFADELARSGRLRDIVHQAYYDIFSSRDTWLNELAELLVRIRYEGQYPLKDRAGLNCKMTGNGMCIGVEVLERSGWSSDSLTENWDMYARYTSRGEAIRLAAGARLRALEPTGMGESSTRRRRWQAGKWQVLKDYAGSLVRARGVSLHQKLDAFAELVSPGPVAHTALGLVAAVVLFVAPGRYTDALAALFALSVVPMFAWTVYGLVRHPRPGRIALHFTRLPLYVAWRFTVIVAAVPTAIRGAWERSPRD